MNEQERIELLKAVVKCAPEEMCAGLSEGLLVKYKVSFHRSGTTLFLDPSFKEADAVFAMLDAMAVRDLGGIGPEVAIELCGCGSEWYCRRWVCPESDSPHKAQEGKGATRAEAVAKAFVQVFGEKQS